MADVCKRCIDAVAAILGDPVYGFNAQFAAIAGNYGISETAELDFTPGTTSVFRGSVTARQAALSPLKGPLTLQVQTMGAQWTGQTSGVKWSGAVALMLVFRVVFSQRLDPLATLEDDAVVEAWANAIFDAVIEAFCGRNANGRMRDWGALGVAFTGLPSAQERGVELLGDGWHETVPIAVGFKVDAGF